MTGTTESRLHALRAGLLFCSPDWRPNIEAMIDQLLAENSPNAPRGLCSKECQSHAAEPSTSGLGLASAGSDPGGQVLDVVAAPSPEAGDDPDVAGNITGQPVAINDPELVTKEDRSIAERPAERIAPRVSPAPATPVRTDPRRAAEEAEIARYLSEKGATKGKPAFVAPSAQGAVAEAVAQERLAGFKARQEATLPEIVRYLKNCGEKAWSNGKDYRLNDKPCARADLWRRANEYRTRKGLQPYALPSAMGAA